MQPRISRGSIKSFLSLLGLDSESFSIHLTFSFDFCSPPVAIAFVPDRWHFLFSGCLQPWEVGRLEQCVSFVSLSSLFFLLFFFNPFQANRRLVAASRRVQRIIFLAWIVQVVDAKRGMKFRIGIFKTSLLLISIRKTVAVLCSLRALWGKLVNWWRVEQNLHWLFLVQEFLVDPDLASKEKERRPLIRYTSPNTTTLRPSWASVPLW